MNLTGWRELPAGSLEQVVAHGLYRLSRGKRPSMACAGVKNPKAAFTAARTILEMRSKTPPGSPKRIEVAPDIPERRVETDTTAPERFDSYATGCAVAIAASLDERAKTPTTVPAQVTQADTLVQEALEQRARLQLARAMQLREDAKKIRRRWRNGFNIKRTTSDIAMVVCHEDLMDISDDGIYELRIIHLRVPEGNGFMPRVCRAGDDGLNDLVVDGAVFQIFADKQRIAYDEALKSGGKMLEQAIAEQWQGK